MPSERSSDRGKDGARRPLPRLTRCELDVLAIREDAIDELGYVPTYRELLVRLGWSPKSKGSLHQYLQRLRRLGLIEGGSGRALHVVSPRSQNDRSEPLYRSSGGAAT